MEHLPGFRFHPTEEELLEFYLRGAVSGKRFGFDIIGTVNLYRHDPWELPGLAKIGEREWYFFVPRDRKHGSGGRPNRTTEKGFWKATGSDRPIRSGKDPKRVIGLKKTLVFYTGRAPRGTKTDWVMNEYRMPEYSPSVKEEIVLCKIYMKATSLKVLEQRAMEGDLRNSCNSTPDTNSSSEPENLHATPPLKIEEVLEEKMEEGDKESEVSSQQLGWVKDNLTELHVPADYNNWDWIQQDPFLLRSPWLENWTQYGNRFCYAHDS